jgi:nonsense-mediated mRNA decay protein 3
MTSTVQELSNSQLFEVMNNKRKGKEKRKSFDNQVEFHLSKSFSHSANYKESYFVLYPVLIPLKNRRIIALEKYLLQGMKILCCLCGVSIDANSAAMCIDCLKAQVDVTGGIDKTGEVVQCRKCERWHIFQDKWTYYALESAGLLSACLRKIGGLNNNKTKLLDAHWIWTEPHSDRLKISVDVESDVLDDKVKLQQKAVIEFVVKHKQCMECIREATDHSWGAMIQIRQKVGHKQSLFLLEHLLTQAGLHNLMISITICKEGLDLFFKARNQAERVVSFISSHMPIKVKKSQKLISRDLKSNFSRYELTYHLEIAPLCKGDLVITSKELTGSLDLMVVTKLSSSVHLLNPMTLSKVGTVPAIQIYMYI